MTLEARVAQREQYYSEVVEHFEGAIQATWADAWDLAGNVDPNLFLTLIEDMSPVYKVYSREGFYTPFAGYIEHQKQTNSTFGELLDRHKLQFVDALYLAEESEPEVIR